MATWISALLLATILAVCPSTASAFAPNPAHNIKIAPRLLTPCYSRARGYSQICKNTLIYSLDRARRDTGLPPYRLPADFLRLPAMEEILILSNLDRIAYSLNPVVGLSAYLNELALEGARAGADPEFHPGPEFPEEAVYEWGSNWAGGREPLLLAYYLWMYDDGYGSYNLACQAPHDSGCWGHRQNILLQPNETVRNPLNLSMGAAALSRDYTTLIVATDQSVSPRYAYTWQEALEDGAGRHVYRVKRPPHPRKRFG